MTNSSRARRREKAADGGKFRLSSLAACSTIFALDLAGLAASSPTCSSPNPDERMLTVPMLVATTQRLPRTSGAPSPLSPGCSYRFLSAFHLNAAGRFTFGPSPSTVPSSPTLPTITL